MIEAKDLRIGNWVEYTPFTGIPEFTEINVFNLADLSGQTDIAKPEWKERYKSIPLTTEILEKCGFRIKELHSDDDYSVCHEPDADFYLEYEWRRRDEGFKPQILPYNGEMESFAVKIKYVHQLQNLYYALTNSELKIDL